MQVKAREEIDAARLAGTDDGEQNALERLDGFLESLPPANPNYAEMSDDEILALKVQKPTAV